MAGRLDFNDLISGTAGSSSVSGKSGKLSFKDLITPAATKPTGVGFLKSIDTVRKQVSGDILDDKAWDVSRNYLKQFNPEDLKAVYGSDNVEEIIQKQQKQARKGLALSEAAGEGMLGITPTQPKLKEEFPVATTATQIGAGVLPYLLPGGTLTKFTAIPAGQEIMRQATNLDDQLNAAQRVGRVGVSAMGGAITGQVFKQADLGKPIFGMLKNTVFNRVLQRSMGAGSTAITENIIKDAISGHTPDAKNALINGGINAASIGILGAIVEVPQLRSAVVREGSRIAGKPVSYKEAVKIVKGNMINPETLSPTFQEAQYQQLRTQAIKQIETETGKSITDRGLKEYLIQKNTQDRANLFDSQAAAEIKFANQKGIDPANGFYARLIPYRELIINGADPVDIYMSMRLADNLRPQPPIVKVVEKPVEPPKPPEIVEAEKAGKVIGIDKKTKLPIVDTAQKPVVLESTPITPSAPATVVSKTPQTPAAAIPEPVKEEKVIEPAPTAGAIDEKRKQELFNSIQEGELILRTGELNDRKLSSQELEEIKRSVISARRKLENFVSFKETAQTINAEPWQMTQNEYRNSLRIGSENMPLSKVREIGVNHKKAVQQALSEGKTVSEEVLKDYPEFNKEVHKTKFKYISPGYSNEDMEHVKTIRSEINNGEAGYRYVTRDDEGKVVKAGGVPSTYPDYFKNKGLTRKNTNAILTKIVEGKQITEKQKAIIDDLIAGHKEQENEKRRLISEGVTESEIKEADRIGEAQAQEDNGIRGYGTREVNSPEEANAFIDEIEAKGGSAQIIHIKQDGKTVISYFDPSVEANITPSGQVRLGLQPPIPEELFQEKGELFDKVDTTGNAGYTVSESEVAYGSREKVKEEIEKARANISNVHATGTVRHARHKLSQIAQDLKSRGFIDFRGKAVNDVQEIAEIVSAFRNPRIEQFQIIFVKNNKVIAHQVVSSGAPNFVEFTPKLHYRIQTLLHKLDADGVYVAHNHPSGNPKPSTEDLSYTKRLDVWLSKSNRSIPQVNKFKGHIITDSENYSIVTIRDGDIYFDTLDFKEKKPDYRSEFYQFKEFSAENAASIAKQFVKNNKIAIIFHDSEKRILSIDNIDIHGGLSQYIKDSMPNYGAVGYILAYNQFDVPSNLSLPEGLTDIIALSADSYKSYKSGQIKVNINRLQNNISSLFRIQEDRQDFAKERPAPAAAGTTPSGSPHVLELPELVKLATELMGKAPVVKRLVSKYGYHKGGTIAIDVKAFENPYFAGAVLAHEVGHLIDWLPEKTMTRGNLLGRLLVLQDFLKNTFDGILVKNKELKEEIKDLTRWWNPFDVDKDPQYTKYRFSSRELYAEALSVLLNEPEKMKELAPEFDKLFWDNIEKKTAVKDALIELQAFLNAGEEEKLIARKGDILKMFKTGEEQYYALRNEYKLRRKDPWFLIRYELIDRNTAVYDKVKQLQKTGYNINPEDRPDYYLEDYNYIGGKIKNLMEEVKEKVLDPLATFDLTSVDFGEYIFLNRIALERTNIANPLGHTPQTAVKQLVFMRQTLGEDRYAALQKAQGDFRRIMMGLLEESVNSGLLTHEKFGELEKNPAYASFQVLDYLDDYVTPSIIKQIGTLKPISNPFASTIMKMISTKRAIERNETAKAVVNFYREHYRNEIQGAPVRRFGKYKTEVIPKEGFGIIKIRVAGKLQGFYVDPYVADSVNYAPSNINSGVIEVLRWCNSSWFRPVYINLNLGFQAFNAVRDFWRAWKLNPHVNLVEMLKKYKAAAPHAFNRVWGDKSDTVIKEMQESGMLSFTYNEIMGGKADENEQMVDYLMRRYQVTDPDKAQANPIKRVFINTIEMLENIGNYIETLPKVAGYLIRKDKGIDLKRIAHEVRTYTGSPDFLRKGAGYGVYNQVFLFSNAIKEGFRGDFEGAFKDPKTRSGYWWKTAKINILPKVLMLLAAMGVFGAYVKEIMDKATEYDKTNYMVIPLGLTPEGKAIYSRIPQDEAGRLLSAIAWKIASGGGKNPIQTASDVGALIGGQIPSFSPAIEIPMAWGQYLMGQNPYDWYKGRTILNDEQKTAGGKWSLVPMLKWTAGQMGAYAFTIKAPNNERPVEKAIRITPVLQRFIRITDYGQKETERKERSNIWRQKAIRTLQRREQRKNY